MSNKTTVVQKDVSDKLTEKEAQSLRILVSEDIAKIHLSVLRLESQRASIDGQISVLNARIGEGEVALADIARRVAGVAYPEEPEKKAPEAQEKKAPEKPKADSPAPEVRQ